MKNIRYICLALLLTLSGCTFVYSQAFKVDPVEPLSEEEIHDVFIKFKEYLSDKGIKEVTQTNSKNPDSAAFELRSGRSGLLSEPFEEYLELSYTPENGFVLKISRIIDQPVDFSEQYIAEFKTKTEQIILEETSKNVRLQVVNANP